VSADCSWCRYSALLTAKTGRFEATQSELRCFQCSILSGLPTLAMHAYHPAARHATGWQGFVLQASGCSQWSAMPALGSACPTKLHILYCHRHCVTILLSVCMVPAVLKVPCV
jgi:hypothetical protein